MRTYLHECPTCGRRLRVREADQGKVVVCAHCKAKFVANAESASSESAILKRANELLEQSQ